MTELDLLNRYARTRDAEAFAQLVDCYQRLILSTCRRRLHDAADLDDAVQETFLRMAKAAGTLRNNVGAWLHRCAINVSTDYNRRRDARLRHESQVVQKPAASTAQQELAELREHLDAALEKLDTSERELIVRRFFIGRSQVELAGEAGVAASTISVRLNQAIEHLRDHLKGAGCAILAAALVEALQKEASSAAMPPELTAKVARVGLSGVAVASASLVTISMVLLLLLVCMASGICIWRATRTTTTQNTPPVVAAKPTTPAAPPTPTMALTVDTGHGAVPSSPTWKPAVNAAPKGALSGTVTDRQGKPIAGALVRLNGISVTTNAQGQYALRSAAVNNNNDRLIVSAPGYQSLGGIHDTSPKIAVSAAAPAVRNVVLDRAVEITIQVRDNHGNPIRQARLDYYSSDGDSGQAEGLYSDRDGLARVALAPSKTLWEIEATVEGYAPAHQELLCDDVDEPKEVELIMSPGISVSGIAICADGKPAAGWGISASPKWSRSIYPPPTAMIDDAGNFTLQHIVAGTYRLTIIKHQLGKVIGEYSLPPASPPFRVDVPGKSAAGLFTLTGVVRADRATNSSIRVTVRGTDPGSTFDQSVRVRANAFRSAKETTKGIAFTVPDIPAGTYQLTVESPEFDPTVMKNVKVPGQPVTIDVKVLGPPHLRGTVVDQNGHLLPRYALRVRRTEVLGNGPNYAQDPDWIQVSDPKGKFDVALVGPGMYEAQASVPGYAWTWGPAVRVEKLGDEAETVVKLSVGGTLRGQVTDAAGRPVVGAEVIPLSMSSGDEYSRQSPHAREAGAVVTDAQGQFEIPHLAAGDETVKVNDADFARLVISGLKIVEGKTTQMPPIKLHVGGSIEGTVYDAEGKTAPGVTIDCQDDRYNHYEGTGQAEHTLGSAVTDSSGHYRIDHLPDQDTYVIASFDPHGASDGVVRRMVHLTDRQTLQTDFGGTAPVRGRLLLAGKPSPNVELIFSIGDPDFGATIIRTRTAADGTFVIYGPPPGDYSVSYRDDASFNRRRLVGDFKLTPSTTDIGDVDQDIGEIALHLDPADAANVTGVGIDRANEPEWGKRKLGHATAREDRTTWIARDVSAGPLIARFDLSENRAFRFAFQRAAGAASTSIMVPRFPQPTAALVMQASSVPGKIHWVILRSDDGANEVILGDNPPGSRTVHAPPGNYFLLDQASERPISNVPPIKAVAGQTTAVDLASLLLRAAK